MSDESDHESSTFWPASSLEGNHDLILSHLERSAPVRLIATFEGLSVALADEPSRSAAARAAQSRFDFLPVRTRDRGPIIGLFERRQAKAGIAVADLMQPLGGQNLISAEAPLLQFIYTADATLCRLVLDGADISGIVTLSDIQRLPVRTVLFGLFIHFELLLTHALKRSEREEGLPFNLLSPERARAAKVQWENSKATGMDRDPYAALLFADKKKIAMKMKLLDVSATKIDQEFTEIEKHLRNPIAHGSDYALSVDGARSTIRAARSVRDWIARIKSAGISADDT